MDKVYRWLVKIYAYKHSGNPLRQLNLDIAKLQHGEKSRERAVLELALHLGLRILELQQLKKEGKTEEEAISEFLKGEKIQLTEDDLEIQEILGEAYRDRFHKPSEAGVIKEKPTALWYLVPFFFGIIGGLIAYVGVKNEDEEMAKNLLFVGFLMFIVDLLFVWLFLF